MGNRRLHRILYAALPLAATVFLIWGVSGGSLEGRQERVDPDVFASDSPIHKEEKLGNIVLFDPAFLPSYYTTCYGEPPFHRNLTIVRPYNGASFPRNIAPPRFRWEDEISNVWRITLKQPSMERPCQTVVSRTEWRPDARLWETIKARDTGKPIRMEVRGCLVDNGRRVGDDVYVDTVEFRVSPLPADPYVGYRLVSPLFHGLKTPSIYYRNIGRFGARMFYPAKDRFCTNCHSFPGNPALQPSDLKLAIAVRGQTAPRRYDRILGLYEFDTGKGKTLNINSFFMSWDPNGKKVAVTGGQRVKVRPCITLETQEFYVLGADINIVDAETLAAARLPGASKPELMESFPSWSPDGKMIVFARAQEMPKEAHAWEERRFDLYKIPYSNGKGGTPVPVPGASSNEKSNFAPRYSPNGKWIVFNRADWSSLVAPTADLWIAPADGSVPARPMECNHPYAMDSHHSWSSNGRWMLFATKRDDGIFARVYLTEVDEQGHASPPVEMPALGSTMMCYNVPEFLKAEVRIDAEDIVAKTGGLK